MRDFKNMKRQRGRNRGGPGGNQGGGRPNPQNVNRSVESQGPEGIKVRGNAQAVFEKYQQLARDSFSNGDRILAENYLQHAEHYFRTLRALQPHRPPSDFLGREALNSAYEIDFEDEALDNPPSAPPEAEAAEGGEEGEREFRRDDRPREERRDDFRRDERPRDDRPRNEEGRRDRFDRDRPRDRDRDRDRDRGFQNDRPRDGERGERFARDGERGDRFRDGERGDRGARDGERGERQDRFGGERRDRWDRERDRDRDRTERPAAAEADEPATAEVIVPGAVEAGGAEVTYAAPAAVESSTTDGDDGLTLRSEGGDESPAPAFLGAPRTVDAEDAGEAPRKPRRRRRRTGDEAEGAAESSADERVPVAEEA